MMATLLPIVTALGTLLSLVLHYLGRKSAAAERAADAVDEVEKLLPKA